MGLIFKGPPSQGYHHFPYDRSHCLERLVPIASPHLLGAVASLDVVLVLLLSGCKKGATREKGQVSNHRSWGINKLNNKLTNKQTNNSNNHHQNKNQHKQNKQQQTNTKTKLLSLSLSVTSWSVEQVFVRRDTNQRWLSSNRNANQSLGTQGYPKEHLQG